MRSSSCAACSSAAFSPDGTRIVTGGGFRDNGEATVWDARTGMALLDLRGHTGLVMSAAFSPDGTRIVTGGFTIEKPNAEKAEATVWDAQTGAALFDLQGHARAVHRVAFTPDGTHIVTRSYDGTAKVWDARTGKELLNEPIPIALAHSLISPDGRLFARTDGNRVELIALKLDAEETAYRLLHSRPNHRRYREGYLAARTAKDDSAAEFYLKLLPPAERNAAAAQADASLFNTMSNRAEAHLRAGKQHEAATVFVELWNLKKSRLGPDDHGTLDTMNHLGVLYWQLRQFDKSVPLFEALLRFHEARHGRDHVDTQRTVANLGVNYKDAGRLKEAIPLLEEAHRATKKYPELRFAGGQLQEAYARAGAHAKLVTLLEEQLAEARKQLPKDSPQLAGILAEIARNLLEQKKWNEAEPPIREALAIRAKALPDFWATFNAKALLGGALLGQKKYAEAEPLLLAGYTGMKQREKTIPPAGKPRLQEAVERLVQLYEETGKQDDAAKWRKALDSQAGKILGPLHEVGPGLALRGRLDGQTSALVYQVKLAAGKTYVIDMVSPDQKALDPYLVLTDAAGKKLAEDDDSGGGLNARIIFRPAQDSTFRIRATSFNGGSGAFNLSVREQLKK